MLFLRAGALSCSPFPDEIIAEANSTGALDGCVDTEVALVVAYDTAEDIRIFGQSGLRNERQAAALRLLFHLQDHLAKSEAGAGPSVFGEATVVSISNHKVGSETTAVERLAVAKRSHVLQ